MPFIEHLILVREKKTTAFTVKITLDNSDAQAQKTLRYLKTNLFGKRCGNQIWSCNREEHKYIAHVVT